VVLLILGGGQILKRVVEPCGTLSVPRERI